MTTPSITSVASPASFKAWFGVVLLFLLFGFVVLFLIGTTPRGNDYEGKRAAVRTEKYETMMAEVHKDLGSYEWTDKAKGVARIPIERAIQLELVDLAKKKPAPAGPIALVAPAATPASVASPAASASPSPAASASPVLPLQLSTAPATSLQQPAMRTPVLPTYAASPGPLTTPTPAPGKSPR